MNSDINNLREDLLAVERQLKDTLMTVKSALIRLNKFDTRTPILEALSQPTTTPAPSETVDASPSLDVIETEEWKAIKGELLNDSGLLDGDRAILVTGGAGVGKTTLLHQFVNECPNNLAVVASTGTAALQAGGVTAHSLFRLPAHALDDEDIEELSGTARSRIRGIKTLIMDEVSMFRADVIDGIDRSMRLNRGNQRPFGGARVIMFGDPYQLPPVVREKDEKKWLAQRYGTKEPYFFHANVFRDKQPKVLTLTQVFRQKDKDFIDTLNAVRDRTLTEAQLARLNAQVDPIFKAPQGELWIRLTTTNAAADLANLEMLDKLPGQARIFDASTTGDFDLKQAPTDEHLALKVGANVIFVRNDTTHHRWVNGTLGRVVGLTPLQVEVNGLAHYVEPEVWEKIAYTFDERKKKLTKEVVGSFSQIPLRLAAAITIHRSQGASLDRVILDLGHGTFANGQMYTGLSRCRCLEGLKLLRPLRMDDVLVSDEVGKFMRGEPIARPLPVTSSLF